MAEKMYGNMVKADVDVVKKIVVLDMGMHSDGENFLLETGSKQNDIWGVNLHPGKFGADEFVEFDSMINLRPSHGNMSKGVDDEKTRAKILKLVSDVVNE